MYCSVITHVWKTTLCPCLLIVDIVKKTVNAITKLALYSPKHHILQSRARNTSFNPIEIIIQITGVSGQKAVLFSRLRPLIIQSGTPVYDS